MYTINVNGTNYNVNASGDTPLLWVLRDVLGLTGTKYGCGIEVCGACTVILGNSSERSCQISLQECVGKNIVTIEGLAKYGTIGPQLQQAWITHQVPQCGYCQSGMLMACAGGDGPGNLCVCGTYQRINQALATVKGKGGN